MAEELDKAARPASLATESLTVALAALQMRLPRIGKSETAIVQPKAGGRAYGYRYANLATVSEAVLPLLGALGLSFTALPTLTGDGRFVLNYALRHVSGEEIAGSYPLPSPVEKGPQILGSAITYARRYCLCAVTGAAPADDDDDAEAAQRADGLPVNKDGSLSRSRTTDEEKDAAGVMTSAQQKEHTALGKPDPLAGPVERGPAPDAAQWETAPEDQPGSLTDQQLRALHVAFAKIRVNDRADRLAKVAQIIGRSVESSKELSYREAGRVLAELDSLKAGM